VFVKTKLDKNGYYRKNLKKTFTIHIIKLRCPGKLVICVL